MRLSVLLLCALAAPIASRAGAETLLVTASGTFTSSTPSSTISQPGATFSLSFDVDSNPSVFNPVLGSDFSVVPSTFSYTINGSPSTEPLGSVTFFNQSLEGLFSVCFDTPCSDTAAPPFGIIFAGDQAYSGSELSPMILTGTYTVDPTMSGIDVNDISYPFSTVSSVAITSATTPSAIPEPSSFLLLGTGLLGMAGTLRRRFV